MVSGTEAPEDGSAELQGNPVTTLPPPPQTVACNDGAVHESGTESHESIRSGMPDSGDSSMAMHQVTSDTRAWPDSGPGKVMSGKSLLESRHAQIYPDPTQTHFRQDELDAASSGLRVATVAGGAQCSVSVDSARDLCPLHDVSDRQSDDMGGGGPENEMVSSSAFGDETASSGTGTEDGAGAPAAAGFEVILEPYYAQETRDGSMLDAVASVLRKGEKQREKQKPGEGRREGGAAPSGYGEDDAGEQSNAGDDGADGGEREGRIDGIHDGQMNADKAPQSPGENDVKEIFGWTECAADKLALDHRSKERY